MKLGSRHNQHSFAQIPSVHTTRSKFNRSFGTKDTFKFDDLTPIFIDEILPGDTINMNTKTFIRLATQVVPVMDRMMLDFYFFFVPCRLVWDNWEKFNGAQDNPSDSTDYLIPTITAPAGGFENMSIYDHFGIPTQVANLEINALPFRAYNLIYNDWFRDQNLIGKIAVPKGDGPDNHADYQLLKAAKPHDYFTSALPWPQKGMAVEMPIGNSAPITYVPNAGNGPYPHFNWVQTPGGPGNNGALSQVTFGGQKAISAAGNDPIGYDPQGTLIADLSSATAATINQLRQAMMMQSLLELDARGGTRYVEILKSHFNVISLDFRLQRPEYLSGGTIDLQQNPVPQTSSSTTDSPQGNLAAFSTASEFGNKIGFSKSFVEHGYVLGFIRARGQVTYQQGLHKMWSRQTRWDFFWPKFQELGEQAILNKEIYAQGNATDSEIFGYQERYGEYRFRPSEIKGQFRSNFAESLDVWHLAEYFTVKPSLNKTFIESNTPIERSLVVTRPDYPDLIGDFWFDYTHVRPMVTYGVPATFGRF
ncbi:major capsid protein [Bdellovibrio phage phiMH2K]|uniref:Capsid protein VP1 n=1 Tax=Bdellovibrio phage phiMH2K TaxID=145579 RepID=CAPSD_BPPHM|nr:major capsid protein [Bdellovibrio phage phiMH2K]Q9G059.1 RecName: Full=Capsid protein VP1; Short=VP1 [Bdellovibrio phage phiMH2K]AAG45340.1 Vp1 [Bdellovibrio phage phiMH2K]